MNCNITLTFYAWHHYFVSPGYSCDGQDACNFDVNLLIPKWCILWHQNDIMCYLGQWLNENEVQGLQEIAKSIVEQFAADPRDNDKSLIGIPLQCRILAECFLQKVQNALEYTRKNNSKTLPQKFASDNVNKKFDLVTLYQMGSN